MAKNYQILRKRNYIILVAGVFTLTAGFILMGARNLMGSNDIYSFQKITLSPVLVLAGYGLLILSIFKS
jgi:hypothetical protein